jgi:hypothetical protein
MSFQLHEWDIHIVCFGTDGAGVADIRFSCPGGDRWYQSATSACVVKRNHDASSEGAGQRLHSISYLPHDPQTVTRLAGQ